MAILVTCTCGKQFSVKDELAGKRGKCVSCGEMLTVPKLEPLAEPKPSGPPPLPVRPCPTCQHSLPLNAVLCVNCGFDLRTGKRIRRAKTSTTETASRTSEKDASSSRLSIALIVAGISLAALAIAVAMRSSGESSPKVALLPKSKPNTIQPNTIPPIDPGSQLPSDKGEIPGEKIDIQDPKIGPGPINHPAVIQKLLAKITAVTPEHVTYYEQFLREPTFLNATRYQGTLPYTGDDVRDAIKLNLDKPALAAIVQLIQEKKNSTEKRDLLICGQAIKALGQFGSLASEATPLLTELQKHTDIAVGSSAKSALAIMNAKSPTPPTPKSPKSPVGVTLLGSKFVDSMTIKVRLDPLGPEEDVKLSADSGKRLLWVELKLTQTGMTTIDLTKLRIEDATGNKYQPTGFKIDLSRDDSPSPRVGQILWNTGLKGAVIPTLTGGSTSTESATLGIDVSPSALNLNLKSGEAILAFFFIVPTTTTDLTLRDLAGGEVVLGTPSGR